jgi:hypothetical protein
VLLGETLGVASVEGFLDARARAEILAEMQLHLATLPERTGSVHSVPGLALDDVLAAYEPAGRTEVTELPEAVVATLDAAADRAMPALRRTYGSAVSAGEWIYLEYGAGQYITPHIDYAVDDGAPDGTPDPPHVAGIGVPLNDDYNGGEFFVETSASAELWQDDARDRIVRGADGTSSWFAAIPRTRWTCRPAAGTAITYGSQLTHGTLPVQSGRIRKIIGFLSAAGA